MTEIDSEFYVIPVSPKKVEPGVTYKLCGGLTKREWFAGMALNAVYTDYMEYSAKHGMVEKWRDGVAGDAYKMADAMIRAGKGEK